MSESRTKGPAAAAGASRFRVGIKELLVAVVAVGAIVWAVTVARDRMHPERATIRTLRSGAVPDRIEAVNRFRNLTPDEYAAAIPALSEALNDADPDVRHAAAEALGPILGGAQGYEPTEPMVKPGMVALLGLLKDSDARVRAAAALSLGVVGAAGSFAPPAPLIETIRDDQDPEVLIAACIAIQHYGYEPDAAIGPLLKAARHAEPRVASTAVHGLAALSPTPAAAPELAAAMADPKPEIRRAAIVALGKIGPGIDPKIVADLVGALGKADPAFPDNGGAEIAQAIGQVAVGSPSADAAITALSAALKSPDGSLRRRAAEALGKFGPAAKSAAPALRSLVGSDPVGPVKATAARALAAIEPPAKP